jgi:hypothetical protein
MEVSKQDWKLFQSKLSQWQEAYMGKLLLEYMEILKEDACPSERFWKLDERIRTDKKSPGVCVTMRKSDLPYIVLALLRDGVICRDDLSVFSEKFQEEIGLRLDHPFT